MINHKPAYEMNDFVKSKQSIQETSNIPYINLNVVYIYKPTYSIYVKLTESEAITFKKLLQKVLTSLFEKKIEDIKIPYTR